MIFWGQKDVYAWRHGGHFGVPKQTNGGMLVSPNNPPGIELYFMLTYSFVLAEKHAHWSRGWKHSIELTIARKGGH